MAQRAAHISRISLSFKVVNFQLVEELSVCHSNLIVCNSRILFTRVESVEIFHDELSATEETTSWSFFISVLSAYLVDPDWKISV